MEEQKAVHSSCRYVLPFSIFSATRRRVAVAFARYLFIFQLFFGVLRLPLELSSLETMLPLHSAIAAARLTSSLSIDSKSWCLVPQGL